MSKKKVKRDAGTRMLPMSLSGEKKIELGAELAQTEIELSNATELFKATAATFNGEKKAMQVKIQELATTLESGEQNVEVAVVEELNLEKKRVDLIRTDTGEIVSSRDAEPGELQGVLFEPGSEVAPG